MLVHNAAFQMSHDTLEEVPDDEWDYTLATNLSAMFHLVKAALPHLAAGPIWTPLIPATMPEDQVDSFGDDVPLGRAGQPAELAPVYVLLASDEASFISGAMIPVTGGNPIL